MDKKALELFHKKLSELYDLAREHNIPCVCMAYENEQSIRSMLVGPKSDVNNVIYSALMEHDDLRRIIHGIIIDISILNLIPDEKPVHNE